MWNESILSYILAEFLVNSELGWALVCPVEQRAQGSVAEGWAPTSPESTRWPKHLEHLWREQGKGYRWESSLKTQPLSYVCWYWNQRTLYIMSLALLVRDCWFFLCCPCCRLLKFFCSGFCFSSLFKTETLTSSTWPVAWVTYKTWGPLFANIQISCSFSL